MTRKLLAEFIGTLAIVYCGVGAIALTSSGLLNGGLIAIAFGHGFAVMGMIYALGAVSGAHFNPAVSLALAPGVSPLSGLAIEIVLTFFLMLVIVRVAVLERHPLSGLLIGLTVTMGISAAGSITGVALNPARAFGPALFSGNWNGHWIMWLGPILGALLGAWTAIFLQGPSHKLEAESQSVKGAEA